MRRGVVAAGALVVTGAIAIVVVPGGDHCGAG
jgi:hypothetical protein